MNTKDKDIDQLTRKLMQESIEQPSSSLSFRIMEMIRQEMKETKVYYVNKTPSASSILVGLLIYLAFIAIVVYSLQSNPELTSHVMDSVKDSFPMMLTIGSGISFFFLFGELDKWLRSKEKHKDLEAN